MDPTSCTLHLSCLSSTIHLPSNLSVCRSSRKNVSARAKFSLSKIFSSQKPRRPEPRRVSALGTLSRLVLKNPAWLTTNSWQKTLNSAPRLPQTATLVGTLATANLASTHFGGVEGRAHFESALEDLVGHIRGMDGPDPVDDVQLRSVVDDYLEEKRGGEGVALISANKGPLLAALQTFIHSHESKSRGITALPQEDTESTTLEKAGAVDVTTKVAAEQESTAIQSAAQLAVVREVSVVSENEKDQAMDQLSALSGRLESVVCQLSSLNEERTQMEGVNRELEQRLRSATATIEEEGRQRAVIRLEADAASLKIQQLEAALMAAQQEMEGVRTQLEKTASMNLQVQLAAAEAAIEEVREQQRLEVEMVGVERDAALLELRVQQVTELNASEELVAEAEREAEEGRAEVGRLEGEQADLQLARQQAELSAARFEQQLGEATAELAERERQVTSLQRTVSVTQQQAAQRDEAVREAEEALRLSEEKEERNTELIELQAESAIERAALVEQIGGLESDLLAETQAKEEAQVSIQGLEGLVANLINKQGTTQTAYVEAEEVAAQLQRTLSRVRAEVAEQRDQVEVLERSLASREEEVEAERDDAGVRASEQAMRGALEEAVSREREYTERVAAHEASERVVEQQMGWLREDLGGQLAARGAQQSQIQGLGLVVAHLMKMQEEVEVQRDQARTVGTRAQHQLVTALEEAAEWKGKAEEVKGTVAYMQRQAAQRLEELEEFEAALEAELEEGAARVVEKAERLEARFVAEQSRLEGEKKELEEEVGRQRREKGAAVEHSVELRERVEELVAQQRELRGAQEEAEQLGEQLQGLEAELAERSGQVAALERSLQETKQQAAEGVQAVAEVGAALQLAVADAAGKEEAEKLQAESAAECASLAAAMGGLEGEAQAQLTARGVAERRVKGAQVMLAGLLKEQVALRGTWRKAEENVTHLECQLSGAGAELEERNQHAVNLEGTVSDMMARAEEREVAVKATEAAYRDGLEEAASSKRREVDMLKEESAAATAALQRHVSMLEEELRVQLAGRSNVEAQMQRLEGVVSHLLREKEAAPVEKKTLTPIPALDKEFAVETVARLLEGDWSGSGGGSVFGAPINPSGPEARNGE